MTDNLLPLDKYTVSPNQEATSLGQKILKEGRVGAILLAGGQGTRLKFRGPKGAYPISPVKKKSLFQLAIEKAESARKHFGTHLHLALQTASENNLETLSFFEKNGFFGSKNHIDFFCQGDLPLLDENETLFLHNGSPCMASEGNGSFFWSFVQSPLFEKWKKRGIEYVTVMGIDNGLSNPFDEEMIGLHVMEKNDVTIKAILRTRADEKVGLIVQREGQVRIAEYNEVDRDSAEQKTADGSLLFRLANANYFCFTMDFIESIARLAKSDFPLHQAKKVIAPYNKLLIKQEYFIFDMFEKAKKIGILLSDRATSFAPLKNAEGVDCPETVKQALLAYYRKLYEAVSGVKLNENLSFELSADFLYPSAELMQKYKGKIPDPGSYLE